VIPCHDRAMTVLALAFWLLAPAQAPPSESTDPWLPVRFFVGQWTGTAEGEPGSGTVKRTYEFVLGGKYLNERNTSTYKPTAKKPAGEVHDHWSFFSHDRARRTLVLRQFHQEGFVNQYALAAGTTAAGFTFESEGFENLPAGWKARERYEKLSPDEFVETFELAPPGKEFSVYSRTHLKRVK